MGNLIDYLPNVLKEIKEFQMLTDAENVEVTTMWQVIDDVMNDQFVDDATENGVKRWENILKVTPKGTDTLDVRKFRILARLNEKLPYTETTLKTQLETLCGADGYTMSVNYGSYTLSVRIRLYAAGKYDEVESLLKRISPANMIVDLSLLYNTYGQFETFTQTQIATYTHDQLREEVI